MKRILTLCLLAAFSIAATDPRGPIQSPETSAKLVPNGVESTSPPYNPALLQKTTPWTALWIRPNSTENPTTAPVSLLRKTLTLTEDPKNITIHLTAEDTFRLYINGKLAARGPADNGRDFTTYNSNHWFFDSLNLTPFFHKGTNTLAVELFSTPFVNSSWHTGHTGFLLEAEITTPASTTLLKSDESWRGTTTTHWQLLDKIPTYNASQEPTGWREENFDDSQWPLCINAGTYWPNLTQSQIPPRMELAYPPTSIERASPGITGTTGKIFLDQPVVVPSDGSFAVRYNRVLSGYIGIKATGSAGTTITIEPNELNTPGHHRLATILLRDGQTTTELPFLDSFSTINITIKNSKTPTTIQDISATFTSQPVTYRGSFSWSDPQLTNLYQAERWATQLCMQTHHLDSPHHQEPISDAGDYLIEARVNYDTFLSPYLPRQDLLKFSWVLQQAHDQNFHTSYSLLWLQMLLDYTHRTHDSSLATQLAPDVFNLLDTYTSWRGKNGLISQAPNYMFMDWVSINDIPCHHPPAVIGQGYLTAFYYRALADAIEIAQLTNDSDHIKKYTQLRTEIKAAFNRELWSPTENLYRDGKPFQTTIPPSKWLPADTQMESFSTQVNALATLYHLAPDNQLAPIMQKIMQREDLNTQPYFMHFVFDALYEASPQLYEKYSCPQLRRWQINPTTQTAREMWQKGDYSHGWSATPVIQLSEHILGITTTPDGTIEIKPTICDLTWAKGSVPTTNGNIEISWTRTNSHVHIDVLIPKNHHALLSLPLSGTKTITAPEGKSSADFQLAP